MSSESWPSASPYVGDRKNKSPQTVSPQVSQTSPERMTGGSSGVPEGKAVLRPFDICRTEVSCPVRLNKPLFDLNREKRKELERFKDVPCHSLLRSGMILLKNFISQQNQVKIVERCRELGLGEGGFYRPGYRDGGKLHLQMMCLGKNWDPETKLYEDQRPIDGAVPPQIPEEFIKLVDEAFQASHDFLRQKNRYMSIEYELPMMSPDICIINFYGDNGKLGLHQDKDESEESLSKGLPVVSFSIGGSADFLFGDDRNEDTAEHVELESGDVLIFGGKSRLIFHGVKSIHPEKAPQRLLNDSKLRPGRLNLTFRQF